MAFPSRIYVFQCGDTEVHGFTLRRDGSNLPTNDQAAWTFRRTASITELGLREPDLNHEQALADLKAQGFHIQRLTAKILPFAKKASH